MHIGIIGAGPFGMTLAQRLSRAGNQVKIANSRAPETINPRTLHTGTRPVWAAEVATDTDVIIVAVNFGRIPSVVDFVRQAPAEAVLIDVTNYFPKIDGVINGLGSGQTESLWAQTQYRRPLVKAWSTIMAESLADKASEAGTIGRIALPVASDDDGHRMIAMTLVEQTGFDAIDAGKLADSWRLQAGTPAYSTDLTANQLPAALRNADARRASLRRDLMLAIIDERTEATGNRPDANFILALTRLLFQ
ncbi:NADPH-dependent F420 reductase [Pseudarthrobacter siccitolerans]